MLPSSPSIAVGELEKAEELASSNLAAMANRVLALHQSNRDAEALALGDSIISRNPPPHKCLMWICRADHTLYLASEVDIRRHLRLLLAHIRKRL